MKQKKVFYPGEDHWRIENGKLKLVGVRCKNCNRVYFPPQPICANCFDQTDMEETTIGPRGKLYSYTIIRVPSRNIEAPYAVGYADFPDDVRVFAQLTEVDPNKLKVDMDVELVLGKIDRDEEGNEIISYKLQKLEGN